MHDCMDCVSMQNINSFTNHTYQSAGLHLARNWLVFDAPCTYAIHMCIDGDDDVCVCVCVL